VPELPEVEVLVRFLNPLLSGRTIQSVQVRRAWVLRPTSAQALKKSLTGARFIGLARRGKYLLFEIQSRGADDRITLIGHLGMTGRMYLLPGGKALPKHAAVVLNLGRERFVFEDTRYFGRLTLDAAALDGLGPEPLGPAFTPESFREALSRSAQPIKVKLLDQSLVAGIGNIYASEALFRAGISPRVSARRINRQLVKRLWSSVRGTLSEAIEFGSTVPLDFSGAAERDGLFYYGRSPDRSEAGQERLLVYDRAGRPCVRCGSAVRRIVQAARSTFFCPQCQRRRG
jgi:formamidopyrimidine-DNA glycosylase